MTRAEQAASRTTGIWAPLTSFVGRAHDAAQLTGLLENYQLVTVTGPGGVGKSRLVTEVARQVQGLFPDGVWFIELGAVADAAQVPADVMSALGVQQDPGRPPLEVLAETLAPRRLLLILDNCEHVLSTVADLCGALLTSADEVHVLATSREQFGVAGEARYRLSPLELPGSDEPDAVRLSAAVALFAERAGQADPRFTLSPEYAPLVARVVARLDGMPLAIELAAARVEALGMAGLADRIDDALRLLNGKDPQAAARHRSLTAVADWSYQLLAEPEQRVFRRLAVFPGPFTLEAAEAVAGPEAGPIVLRLVDCSLLVPPRSGADQRTRYTMLQTLRAYALTRLRDAGEEQEATSALAAFAWSVAEQAAAELEASATELAALRWLDAEDATLSRALSWALEHDPDGAMRLATALVPWLRLRGRLVEARERLSAAVARSSPADETWAKAQLLLGFLSSDSVDSADGADHHTAAIEAYRNRKPSPVLVEALAGGRAIARLNLGDMAGAVHDARRALALARELGDAASELFALTALSVTAYYAGDAAEALDWTRQAQELLPLDIRGHVARWCHYVLALVLTEIGVLDSARRVCAAGLALSRQVDDLTNLVPLLEVMADLELLAGNPANAGVYLGEAVGIASRIGHSLSLASLIEHCGYLCAATRRWADAVTLWAALAAALKRRGRPTRPVNEGRHAEYMRQIEQALEPGQLREAEERGAMMPLSAAAELAIMVATAAGEESQGPAPGKPLSPRERELVTLVAQGHTNAEIAAQLYISIRTVASHLDRIRDKTGHRRRADLTRLALEESLV
ncbi:MAG TPA: LuxR C-terminal-related transcriptional regulator [Streptosporangiaceae bacterium]|nr:LuxR C-terminal-related transcriptional regulator [Streptosporangiaceae bacterium]